MAIETRPKSRIRLFMATSDLDGGGAERQFSLLMENLPRQRFETHVCFWRPVFRYVCPQDLPVYMVRKTRSWHVFRAIYETSRLIDKIRPQVVFSQPHYVNMVMGSALATSRHQPRWVCRQVNDPKREMKGFFALWARWALRRADRIVGPSEGVRQEVIRYLGVPEARTLQIDNLADVGSIERGASSPLTIEKQPDTFTVVHAGRFQPQKNQALLLQAFGRLEDLRCELWILGQGPLEPDLRALAQEMGIEDRVRWLGFQQNPFPFFRAADVVVLSSDYEGLPNVVIESMLCGTAVVSTRCPYGPDELIAEGETGLLVPVGNCEALSSALRLLATDRERSAQMGEEARKRAQKRFRTPCLGLAYRELFESLAEARRENPS